MQQIARMDKSISTVISNRFETFHNSNPKPQNEAGPAVPIEALMDVTSFDDESFVRAAEGLVPEGKGN